LGYNHGHNIAFVARESVQRLAAGHVPDLDHIFTARCDVLAIWAVSHGVGSLRGIECVQRLARGHVPNLDPIFTGRCKLLAIGAVSHGCGEIATIECVQRFARSHVPDLDHIFTPRCDVLAIGAVSHGLDSFVAIECVQRLERGHAPDLDAIFPAASCEVLAIGAVSHCGKLISCEYVTQVGADLVIDVQFARALDITLAWAVTVLCAMVLAEALVIIEVLLDHGASCVGPFHLWAKLRRVARSGAV
jgi:hypothetical protein